MKDKNLFLSESKARIEEAYENRSKKMPKIFAEISKELDREEESVKTALKYLYAHMPNSDIGNYHFSIYADYAKAAVLLWETYERVQQLPEEIFLNYILFHRVNEEEIAPCRTLFLEEMKKSGDLLDLKEEKEIALEVNYWCTGEATYHTTDERTLSARMVYLRGNGRCGEESVFVVNAMRSAGIAARQVYAPRWSHCDDNHAWVEVFCEGKWYFMGACEAEPILNRGWFTNASSRAMMIHSRWFDGVCPQNEDIIGRDGIEQMLNQLERYAKTVEIEVLVTDIENQPLRNQEVQFEILNYAEYVPIASAKTDDKGKVRLHTGLGSICVSINYDENYISQWIDTRNQTTCHLVAEAGKKVAAKCEKLFEMAEGKSVTEDKAGTEDSESDCWKSYDFTAPLDSPVNAGMPTAQQKAASDSRIKRLSEKCAQKMKTWKNPQLQTFLSTDYGKKELQQKLISCLTEKDLTDCKAQVLEEHLLEAAGYEGCYPEAVFTKALLNPRIDDEVMTAYRRFICEHIAEDKKTEYRNIPVKIWEDIDHTIEFDREWERASLLTVPCALLKQKTGSFLSKKVLFVAIARSLGIPARLNPEDKSMEYWENGSFQAVLREQEKDCTLVIEKPVEDGQDWIYTHDWTIAKWTTEGYKTLLLEAKSWDDGKIALDLEKGLYRILTVNRLPNGNIFEAERNVCLQAGERTSVVLKRRKANLSDMLENIRFQDFVLKNENGEDVQMSRLSDSSRRVFIWLEESKEPTEHILNEIFEQKEIFQKYASSLEFIVRTKEALLQPTLARVLEAIDGIEIFYDDFTENINVLGRRMYVDFEKLPFVLITDGALNGIYAATGYNVGMADMIVKILE